MGECGHTVISLESFVIFCMMETEGGNTVIVIVEELPLLRSSRQVMVSFFMIVIVAVDVTVKPLILVSDKVKSPSVPDGEKSLIEDVPSLGTLHITESLMT
jgi:hypothetical protein